MLHFVIINFGALIAAAGGIFLKRLSDQIDHGAPALSVIIAVIASPYFWFGGICYVVPILFWTYLLKFMELTKLQPQLSLVYIYTIALAAIFLGETPNAAKMAGTALIIAGVVIVGRS